jgi:hypothetical protein
MTDSRWLIKTKMTPRKAVQFAADVGGEATAVVVVTLTAATHNDVRKLEQVAGAHGVELHRLPDLVGH